MGVADARNLTIWCDNHPPEDVQRALLRLSRAEDVIRVAAMPDVHLAKDVCIGTALATRRTLYPAAVGGDIGCGMAALRIGGDAKLLSDRKIAEAMLCGFQEAVPVLRHRVDAGLPRELSAELSDEVLEKKKVRTGGVQLGTLGRGNHFLEIQADHDDDLWIMVHSGSRGIGQAIRDHHIDRAKRRRGGLFGLDVESEFGRSYLADVAWALEYAAENRRRIMMAAVGVLEEHLGAKAEYDTFFSCHHNHVRHEIDDKDGALWVHRKGAISARNGEAGIIPGSMGSASFHVEGRGCREALCSSSHGAGRTFSRSAARNRVTVDDLKRQMRGIWFDDRLAYRLRDEAPSVYKDIGKVMKAQRELTRVTRHLRPVLVYKGA